MLERLIIAGVISIVGVALYRGVQWLNLRRVSRLGDDPILADWRHGKPAILYFTAEFCVPCRTQQRPALDRLRSHVGDRVQIIQVDAEHATATAARWGVMSLPTTFVLDGNGKPQAVNYGVASTEKLLTQIGLG